MRKLLSFILLACAFALGQTTTGGVTFSSSGAAPPPQPCITSGPPSPSVVQGQSYNAVFTAGCGLAPYVWSIAPDPPAPGITLATVADQGILSGIAGAPGIYGYNLTVTDANGQTASAPFQLQIVSETPPTITSGTPPGGKVGVAYGPFTFTASGASPPFTFSLIFGTLPPGLSLVNNVLSGTPTTAGNYNFQVRATDNIGVFTNSPTYTIAITPSAPQITSSPPPGGTTGSSYLFPLTACCGTPPYIWSSTPLPPGISLNAASGIMSATSLGAAGIYTFTITVTDANLQIGQNIYTITILPQVVGSSASLPTTFVNSHECDGTITNTINFPADGLGMHGGTPYANTQAGVNSAIADANTKRDSDGTGTAINFPHNSPFSGTVTLKVIGSNSATGLASTNCIVLASDTPQTPNQTVCSHGVRETDRNTGCANDAPGMWAWSQTNSANPVLDCNTAGSSGPAHHYVIKNMEIRDANTGPIQTNGIALGYCGTNNETTEAAQPNHIHVTQNYIHGYDTPDISALRGFFYSMHDSSFDYNYFEMIHGNSKEGQCLATQQSARIKIDHNWIEGCSEAIFVGGAPPAIAAYNPSDFEIRGNMLTLNYAWEAISSCVSHTHNWVIKNRLEHKNMIRSLIDGNFLAQSWCDGQAGFLMLMNVRAISSPCGACTSGNNSTVSDVTVTNNIFAHSAQSIQTDAGSGGTGNTGGSGFGQALKGRRWLFQNNLLYDIGDFTRYPGTAAGTIFTSVQFQLGTSGQSLSCALTRDGGGVVATAVCTAQINVPGTGMEIGDPVKLSSCIPDTGFNVGTASVGPPILTGSPSSLTFTFANTGTAGGTATCTLDNTAGSPHFITYNHNSVFTATNSNSFWVTEGQSPNFQYPQSNNVTNSIFASNGGNPGGIAASAKAEGTSTETLWDITTFHFNANVLTGRKASSYTLFQTGETANAFPGNNVGLQNNQTGITCSGPVPDLTCLGIIEAMNGVPYQSNPVDYHNLALKTNSVFAAGQVSQASDGLGRGADITKIDAAINSLLYTCLTPCGTGPFPDAAGVFMVPTGGDNAHDCTFTKPCGPTVQDGDPAAAFAAAKTAVQLLPVGSKAVFLRTGTYRPTSTLTFAAGDSGTSVSDRVLWRNYPGEAVTITGNKQVTGLADIGACGANCEEYTVTQAAASWQNYETLYYNGDRRPRPQATGSVHGYIANACPTSATNDPNLCVAGATLALADVACACPAAVTGAGGHCAGTQTKACSGATPNQCFNKYLYTGADIDGTWHALNVGDVELLVFEDWDMSRMRLLSAAAGVANFTGTTAQTNNHGCQGGHFYIAENVKENRAKGQWYLDRCPTGCGGGVPEANWVLHIYADTLIGETPLTADIEVPQLSPSNPQVIKGTSANFLAFQGLTIQGDNWQPAATGLGDQQGMPAVSGAVLFTNGSNILIDGVTISKTTGWGLDFQATSTHDTIQNSHLSDLGGGGIRFGTSVSGAANAQASDTNANVPQFNTIQNNLIDHPGRIQPSGIGNGIFFGDGHDFLITHNEIAFSYSGCIGPGFGLKRGADDGSTTQQFFIHHNITSYNLCYGQNNAILADFGGIYLAPSYSTLCPAGTPLTGNPCNQVLNNFIHDMYNNYDLTQAATSSGARGIYCDQGCTNTLIQNNLIARVGHSAIFLNQPQITGPNHFLTQNNLADNNILAQCGYINGAFAANLPLGCLAKNGVNGSAFTYSHNIAYMNGAIAAIHWQSLVGSWPCFLDDGVTPVACTSRFTLASNDYWNIAGAHPLAFGTCKSTAEGAPSLCAAPFNGTNFFQFSANGAIPAGWTNPWLANGTAAGEDAGSVAVDPGFVDPTCATDDWHYSHSFAGQGITQFDYTLAGRLPSSPYSIPTVSDLFPVRSVACLTDF